VYHNKKMSQFIISKVTNKIYLDILYVHVSLEEMYLSPKALRFQNLSCFHIRVWEGDGSFGWQNSYKLLISVFFNDLTN